MLIGICDFFELVLCFEPFFQPTKLLPMRAKLQCRRFLVGGRLCGSEYLCLSQHPLPKFDGLPEDMFVPIPDFRVDVSSTQLRRGVGYTRTSTHNRQSS